MCTPTAGSPTITLFQLRSNYHTLLNVYKVYCLKQANVLTNVLSYRKL